MTEPAPIAAIIALGITQIIGYGTLYYSFSILAPDMSRDLGWSSEAVFGALSAALLIGGLMAPALGKWIDRFGAGRIVTAGSAIAAAALVACALAPGRISFVAALIGIEAASNLSSIWRGLRAARADPAAGGTTEHHLPDAHRRVCLDDLLADHDNAAR